jgi:hypothetical protein
METRDPAELREYLAVTAELKYRGAHPNQIGEHSQEPDRSGGEARDAANWDTEKLKARLRRYQRKGENIGYMGDKRKQLVLEHGYDSKNAAHLIRLLRMCIEVLTTGEMHVKRPDAAELIDIKRGKWPLESVKSLSTSLFLEAKAAWEKSELPAAPDRKGAEALLVELVWDHLKDTAKR